MAIGKLCKAAIILAAAARLFLLADAVEAAPRRERRANAARSAAPERPERVMKALAQAYPHRIARAEFRSGDWAVLMDDTWFFFAEGRLLPEEHKDSVSDYSPIQFYNYSRDLPPWTEPTPEQIERFSGIGGARPARSPRANYFYDTLFRTGSRAEADELMEKIDFFGKELVVHPDIAAILSIVTGNITAAGAEDPQVQAWIDGIGRIYGWNWRNIADSQSRSYHSYGMAIDILPVSLEGRHIYWLWTGDGWWNIPYERRFHPPDAVVKAFESYGFVWGGKWLLFDAMHFEYRPEVFILNELELLTLH